MSKSLSYFISHQITNFFEGVINFYLFIPYVFSVTTLLKTLFAPWKGLTDKSHSRGLNLNDLFNVMMFNLISVGIGFLVRSFMLMIFFIVQSLYIILMPVLIGVYLLFTPVQFLLFLITPTEEEQKERKKQQFIKTHALTEASKVYVEQWFEYTYQRTFYTSQWWKLHNLFEIVPLANDWAAGYTPKLDKFSSEMTGGNYQKNRNHVVGRETEVKAIEQALLRTDEANVLLVGEEGVGKHTIVDAFARNIYHGKCNPLIAYKRVLKLHMDQILSTYTDQTEREAFFGELLAEAMKSKNVILVIDNIDTYISGGSPDRVDLSNPIEEYGKSSQLQIIGITTPFNYDKYIFFNERMRLLFDKVEVNEITKEQTMQVLFDMTPQFERRYRVHIPFETLAAVVEKSDFFITTIPFPGKAVELLDSVCVYVNEHLKHRVVLPEVVDTVLSAQTHTPTTLTEEMKQKLLNMESQLQTTIVNQPEAVHELSATMRRAFLLLGKRRKPLASLLFLGPTGVGKTETAKTIANTFFNSDKAMIRFDMSLYQSTDDIPKLIGSLETQNPGLLTTTIREQPYGVLLLDEIEKADKNLLNIFLTILDEGYFTDGFGQRVDCKNLVIIATSNAGADFLYETMRAGKTVSGNELIAYLIEKRYYTPEFLNRFDGVVAFRPIQGNSMLPIARKFMQQIEKNIMDLYQVKLEVSDATLEQVLASNVDPAFGARNLERVLRDQIEDQVAQLILSNKAQPGSTIRM